MNFSENRTVHRGEKPTKTIISTTNHSQRYENSKNDLQKPTVEREPLSHICGELQVDIL